MALFARVSIFLLLFFLGLTLGWEFGLAGVIFFLTLNPRWYEFTLWGVLMDGILSFPPGFFTVSTLVLLIGAAYFSRYFEAKHVLSFLLKIGALLLLAVGTIFLYYLPDFWDMKVRALMFSGMFLAKSLAFLLALLIFSKLVESVEFAYAPQSHPH